MLKRLINERVITSEYGIITCDILNPRMDAKGNWISGQIELQNRLWEVVRTDQWEEEYCLWEKKASIPPPLLFPDTELTRPAGFSFLK